MLTRLRAKNFKSWKDTGPLRLGPLTGFFGANSSGKTSLLQILLMLKQTVKSPDRRRVLHTGDEASAVDLGTFHDLMHGHDLDAQLELELSWALPAPLVIYDPRRPKRELYRVQELKFEVAVNLESGTPVVGAFAYTVGEQRLGMKRAPSNFKAGRDNYALITGSYPAKRARAHARPLPSPVKCYGFPEEVGAYYQNLGFLPDLVLEFERAFQRISYLGPLREYPKRSYVWAGERPVDVGRRGDQAVGALLAARAERLERRRGTEKARRYRSIEARILEWLRRMNLIHSFTLKEIAAHRKDYEFRARQTANGPEVLITDLGFGVSQILPVLVLCYYVPEGSTILLEQPEIHLHPSVQADLADVLIDVATEGGVQILVESHSEHLLRRLQRRVAEGAVSAQDAALYFVAMQEGVSRIEPLDIDPYGNIRNWPPGFFGDELGELAAMTKAAIQRRRAAS